MLCTRPLRFAWKGSHWNDFSWQVRKGNNVDIFSNSKDRDRYFLVDCKFPGSNNDEYVREIMRLWHAERPNTRTPDMLAIRYDGFDDDAFWMLTRIGRMMFTVHIYSPFFLEEDGASIADAGVISVPLYNWRLLRVYAFFIGHMLRDLARATEKLFHPDGEGAMECAKRFKLMAGLPNTTSDTKTSCPSDTKTSCPSKYD